MLQIKTKRDLNSAYRAIMRARSKVDVNAKDFWDRMAENDNRAKQKLYDVAKNDKFFTEFEVGFRKKVGKSKDEKVQVLLKKVRAEVDNEDRAALVRAKKDWKKLEDHLLEEFVKQFLLYYASGRDHYGKKQDKKQFPSVFSWDESIRLGFSANAGIAQNLVKEGRTLDFGSIGFILGRFFSDLEFGIAVDPKVWQREGRYHLIQEILANVTVMTANLKKLLHTDHFAQLRRRIQRIAREKRKEISKEQYDLILAIAEKF